MTVEAMSAAVLAIRAGAFDGAPPTAAASALTAQPPRGVGASWAAAAVDRPVVLVVAGHAGAGASTVALTVAEGLAAGRPVSLVEYAEPTRSGLASASTIELGVDGAWRVGRRGRLDVLRPARSSVDDPPAPPGLGDGDRLLVVDAGRALTRALLHARTSSAPSAVVVVTRVTVPAIRQTEHVLAAVGGDAWVAAVGPSRWPRAVVASCGSNLGRLRSQGRVVRVPLDARLEVSGLTGDRLPRSVAVAGRRLAGALVPAGPPRHRRRAATSPSSSPRAVRARGIR
jgi:hypothetical protein